MAQFPAPSFHAGDGGNAPCTLNIENWEKRDEGNKKICLRKRITDMVREQRWEMLIDHLSSNDLIAEIALCSDNHPLTLLHIACTILTIPVNVILAIIKLIPNAILTEDEDGSLPIHLACAVGLSLQVIEALMVACPASCFLMDHQNEFPMHYVLKNQKDLPDIEQLLTRLPPSCIYNESTSLFHEVRDGVSHEGIIHQAIKMHPQICHIQNKNGYTLLHMLCYDKNSTPKTIRMVINCNLQACATTDNNGNLPLHHVNSEIYSEEIVQILLNRNPQGIFTPNIYGETPLFTDSQKKIKAILSYCDPTKIRRLLCTTNNFGLVPGEDLFYRVQRDLTNLITRSHEDRILASQNSKYYQKLDEKITSLFLLTRAYSYGSIDEINVEHRLTIPHQLLFWTSFPLFTKVLMQHFPYLAKEQDCNGDLPLHAIAKCSSDQYGIGRCNICGDAPIVGLFLQNSIGKVVCNKCCSTETSFVKVVKVECQKHEVMIDVLRAYPQAASIPDRYGNLPLHICLHSGKMWHTGVKEMFEAAPHAIQTEDTASNLRAFMITASKSNINNDKYPSTRALHTHEYEKGVHINEKVALLELTTVFELLQRDPCQVMQLQK